jgi:hypothetical protein
MTTGDFRYLDPATFDPTATAHPAKPWAKVDGPGTSYGHISKPRKVGNLREQETAFTTDNAGFQLLSHRPSIEKAFTSEEAIREGYYGEVAELLKAAIPGVRDVVIFDHTVRRNQKASPRQPVQQVHVDQTPGAAAARVRRHVLPEAEAETWLKGRYQIINVWRPIGHPASDFPLAMLDWRSTDPQDFVKVDLLYPSDAPRENGSGKEVAQKEGSAKNLEGYEVRGETYGLAPNESHQFYFVKDMTPDEVVFLKCFDSYGERVGRRTGIADNSGHTAFVDPDTPKDAPGRQSIEVRCLVSYA